MESKERRRILTRELNRILKVLRNETSVQKVILFGSLNKHKVHEWSDIDLVIIQETNLSFYERMKELLLKIKPRVGIDVLVYTPNEFKEIILKRNFIRDEIWQKGKVLYER